MRLVFNIFFGFLFGNLIFAVPGLAAEDLNSILAKLDAAAARFKSTTADFEFDSVITDPVPDTEVQKGTAFYRRKGAGFEMAYHIHDVNGKAASKTYVYSGGKVRLWEPQIDQVTTIAKAGQYEGYMMLGFGASGKDLAGKWDMKYLGPETLGGVMTEKLELVAKDPAVRKNFSKVTLWVDTNRGVSLKQVWDEGQGQSRTCNYSNVRINQSVPSNAFAIKTDSKTQYVNH